MTTEIQELTSAVYSLKDDLDERHEQNTKHNSEVDQKIDRLSDKVDLLFEGFPGGKPIPHANWHENQTEKENRRAKRWEKTMEGFNGPALLAVAIWGISKVYDILAAYFHWKF